MRVTNSMMRSNSLMNMQKNKVAYNKYLEEYTTQKKIQRASDDPTIAVRALKYRSSLTEISQYLSNSNDAISWMDQTENSMKDINSVMESLVTYSNQASTDTFNIDDREDILTQMKEYVSHIFEQDANADYAGRYLFTGFRTDVPLLFDAQTKDTTYTITEKLEITDIKKYQFVYGEASYDASKDASIYASEASDFKDTHRIMVSYHDNDEAPMVIKYTDAHGVEKSVTAVTKMIENDTTYNEHLYPGEDEVFYVPETGEILFGDAVYDDICGGKDMSVEYKKTYFEENDIRPEHYFDCSTLNEITGETAIYTNPSEQNINYQVNFSQTLTVNTMACNALSTSLKRTIDDISNACNDLDVMQSKLKSVQMRIDSTDETDKETLDNLNELKKQIDTQITLQSTVVRNAFASSITTIKNAQTQMNVAFADHGSRYDRLNQTKIKLETSQTDTEEAKSENEDADLGDAYIKFSEADLLYQATLNVTNKVLGQSLLNFI